MFDYLGSFTRATVSSNEGGYSKIFAFQINRLICTQLLEEIEAMHQDNKQILQVLVLI